MKYTYFLLGLLLLPTILAPVRAQDELVLEKMKPLLEDDTLGVIYIDLERIDVTAALNNNRAFLEKAFRDMGGSEEELAQIIKTMSNTSEDMDLDGLWKRLLDLAEGGKTFLVEGLGIKEAFAVIRLGKSFPNFGYIAIPKTDKLNTEAFPFPFLVTRETEKYFYLSNTWYPESEVELNRELAAKLGSDRPVERADFLEAAEAVRDYPIRFLVAPPAFVKKVFDELKPSFPAPQLKDIDVSAIVKAFRYKAVGLDPVKGELLAVVEAETELDAKILEKTFGQIYDLAAEEGLKYFRSLAEKKESQARPLWPKEEMILSLYPEIINEESLAELKTQILPKPQGKRFVVKWSTKWAAEYFSTSGIVLAKIIQINVEQARESSRRMHCTDNLKILALAMNNYHDANQIMPPAFTVDANGKPLHSWRVALLPYLEQVALYESIRKDEPWDSEYNRQFHDKMPALFRCPSCTLGNPASDATYCLVVGENTLGNSKGEGVKFSQMTDGTSNTLMFVERKTPFCWMAPTDITEEDALLGINKSPGGIGSEHPGIANCALCDGSVQAIDETVNPEVLKAILTIAGGEGFTL